MEFLITFALIHFDFWLFMKLSKRDLEGAELLAELHILEYLNNKDESKELDI